NTVGHKKFCILRPAVGTLGESYFLITQWLSMGGAGVLLIRSTPADVTVNDNQGGPISSLEKRRKGALDLFEVIRIADARDIPPVSQKPIRHVFGEGKRCVAFDSDVVVVIDPA